MSFSRLVILSDRSCCFIVKSIMAFLIRDILSSMMSFDSVISSKFSSLMLFSISKLPKEEFIVFM